MKTFIKCGLKSLIALAAAATLAGCATDVGYAGAGYYGDYGPDYYGYYGPSVGYAGGDYYAYGHHRWGRYDHDFHDHMTSRRSASAGFHSSGHAVAVGGGVRTGGGFHGGGGHAGGGGIRR